MHGHLRINPIQYLKYVNQSNQRDDFQEGVLPRLHNQKYTVPGKCKGCCTFPDHFRGAQCKFLARHRAAITAS